jgi:hypothetical protein
MLVSGTSCGRALLTRELPHTSMLLDMDLACNPIVELPNSSFPCKTVVLSDRCSLNTSLGLVEILFRLSRTCAMYRQSQWRVAR